MKISVIQSCPAWENKELNLKKLKELILPLFNKTDIVVLPEMFSTGFSMNPGLLGEEPGGETLRWMKSLATGGHFGLCGSYIAEENGLFFNRWAFVTPDNKQWFYDKRHLFSFAGEDKIFTAGKNRLVFTFRGIRILPNVCYDLRFPVWSRNRNDYDLMINSANWPESRRDVWLTLLKARALENQCYVVAANVTGTDGNGIFYRGDSMIISPKGTIISTASSATGISVTSDISLSELEAFRKKFPALNDADEFTIEL
jgi:predicted amidohydrolase